MFYSRFPSFSNFELVLTLWFLLEYIVSLQSFNNSLALIFLLCFAINMNNEIQIECLHRALSKYDIFSHLEKDDLKVATTKGLVHDHVLLRSDNFSDYQMVVRIPRLSQFGLEPKENLKYQAACFSAASPSNHTPKLILVVEPSANLPMGALVVEHIKGKNIVLPSDLNGMAECFARVHSLQTPETPDHSELLYHIDPIRGVVNTINEQSKFINEATSDPEVQKILREEVEWASDFANQNSNLHPPHRLCLTDTHPGNFLVDASGKVFFVDLEKALYGSPAIDLGHATILTSTLWDFDIQVELSRNDIINFYQAYLDFLPVNLKNEIRPWLMPMRRLAWIRSTTWSCKWSTRKQDSGEIEEGLRGQIQNHIVKRLASFVDLKTINSVRSEWIGENRLALI